MGPILTNLHHWLSPKHIS